ncbi:MAG: 30S ribosomal protein S20 [Candidatus Margulisbacteria bacterium]|nr:30S ribosomal protein S20 [Candidatus Margulisiibacteriota bacterium]
MAAKKPIKRKHVKNVRKTKKQRARNVREKNFLKAALKAARLAVASKAADVLDKIKKAVSVLDKAAERKIIHANKAARLKSRLNLAYNKTK